MRIISSLDFLVPFLSRKKNIKKAVGSLSVSELIFAREEQEAEAAAGAVGRKDSIIALYGEFTT